MNLGGGPVAPVMASIATEGRSAFISAFFVSFVLALVLLPWQPSRVYLRVDMREVKRPPVIVPMELDAGPGLVATIAELLAPSVGPPIMIPPVHPDGQVWPKGMVIAPLRFEYRMPTGTGIPEALDRLLSGLLGPWHSESS
ncbi:MAG TPA: hypothetical protein VIV11_19505 [Kofleriaceae bacterium]